MEAIKGGLLGTRYPQACGLSADDDQQSNDDAANSARKLIECFDRPSNNFALVHYVCVPLHWNDYVGLFLVNSNTPKLECKRAEDDVETCPRTETKGHPKTELL